MVYYSAGLRSNEQATSRNGKMVAYILTICRCLKNKHAKRPFTIFADELFVSASNTGVCIDSVIYRL